MVAARFEVVLVELDPVVGAEIRKTRPCVVISPDEMNRQLQTLLVAPMTTRVRRYPFRIGCRFQGKDGQVALNQMRAIDRCRVVRRLGAIAASSRGGVLRALRRMFAP